MPGGDPNPGGRQSGGLGNPAPQNLTGRLKQELDGLLALWMKQVRVHSLPVTVDCREHSVKTGFYPELWQVSLAADVPKVRESTLCTRSVAVPIQRWQADVTVQQGPCGFSVPRVHAVRCWGHGQAALYTVALCRYQPLVRQVQPVAFRQHALGAVRVLPIPGVNARLGHQLPFVPLRLKLATESRPVHLSRRVSTWRAPRPWFQLPLLRRPVPLYRFAPNYRDKFRQALAEKAGIGEARVQVTWVYDRIDLTTVGGFEIDPQGQLWITPKPELTGEASRRSRPATPNDIDALAAQRSAWVVLGVRLDTQAAIRAVVPVSAMQGPLSDES
jgi:hypothetical protein